MCSGTHRQTRIYYACKRPDAPRRTPSLLPRPYAVQPTPRSRARTCRPSRSLPDPACQGRRPQQRQRQAVALAPGRRITRSTGTGAASSQRLPSPTSRQTNRPKPKPPQLNTELMCPLPAESVRFIDLSQCLCYHRLPSDPYPVVGVTFGY